MNRAPLSICLNKAYNSNSVKKEIIKRGYVPHIIYKRKRGEKTKTETDDMCRQKRYPARRWL
ncbi:MAG: hypothetical protein ABJB76_01490 [Candidatus Nitrosocosmicus sp.]